MDNLIALLRQIKKVFDKYDVTYWLDAGTLLKAVRDSNIVPSWDIDLGSWQSEIDKIILACEELKKDGFKVKYQDSLGFVEDKVQIHIPDKYKVPLESGCIDLCMYTELNNEAVRRSIKRPVGKMGSILLRLYRSLMTKTVLSPSVKRRIVEMIPHRLRVLLAQIVLWIYIETCKSLWFVLPLENLKTLSEINLYSLRFKIPSKTEEFLEYRYGPDWKIPIKNWKRSRGKAFRFRRLNKIKRKDRIYRQIHSETFEVQVKRKRGVYNFTKDDILKIKNLG